MMKTITITLLILNASLCMSATAQKTKRSAPKEVTPVVHEGVGYTAPHWVVENGKRIAGGYVEAFGQRLPGGAAVPNLLPRVEPDRKSPSFERVSYQELKVTCRARSFLAFGLEAGSLTKNNWSINVILLAVKLLNEGLT